MTANRDLRDPAFVALLGRIASRAKLLFEGERAGGTRDPRHAGMVFRDHRAYSPGDDPRAIDWNAFGRFGVPFVKRFEAEEGGSLAILLDASPSMAVGSPPPFELAVRLAAAFGFVALTRAGGTVVLAGAASGPERFRGGAGADRMLARLSRLGPGDAAAWRDSARRLEGIRAAHGLLLTDGEPPEEAARALVALPHGRSTCVQVLAREDFDPDPRQAASLVDPESGRTIPVPAGPRILERYRRLARARAAEVEAVARRAGAAFARVFSDEPFESTAANLLGRAGARAAGRAKTA